SVFLILLIVPPALHRGAVLCRWPGSLLLLMPYWVTCGWPMAPPLRRKWNVVVHVSLGRPAARSRFVLRLHAQRQKFVALLRGLDPGRKPVFGAINVDAAAIVEVVVLGLFVTFAEQDAAIIVVKGDL